MKGNQLRNQKSNSQQQQTGTSFSLDSEDRSQSLQLQQYSKNQNKESLNGQESDQNEKQQVISRIYEKLLDNRYQDITEDILVNNQDIDILSIKDRKGLTLVHRMTLHMKLKELETIINYALKYLDANKQKTLLIKNWIDKQNDEGFTALHYASFKGDLDILQYLMSLGADYSLKNKNGLNVLHIAAQGDQPISLCYFDGIEYDLNQTDEKGGTALHWACYLGSENAVNYLVSKMQNQINKADGEGLTPLHLSAISGNARIVKKLLQRGADRHALDQNNKTPAILAQENDYINIQQMLEKTGGFAEYCNIKQPFKPIDKNPKQLIVLMLLLVLVEVFIISFIIPCMNFHFPEFIVWAIFMICTLISLILAWRTNPGFVTGIRQNNQSRQQSVLEIQNSSNKKKQSENRYNEFVNNSNINNSMSEELNQNLIPSNNYLSKDESLIQPQGLQIKQQSQLTKDLINLYKSNDASRVCVECCIVKPKRSRHCEICKKCIRVYDHHCPWINNCVGTQNYKYFILFIVFMWFNMLTSLILILLHISSDYRGDETHDEWIFSWYSNLSPEANETLKIFKYIISGILIILIFIFFVLHSILCFVQIGNLFLNQTTFERHNANLMHPAQNSSQLNRSSQINNNESSINDVNPSIILSNSHNQPGNSKIKSVQIGIKYSFENATIMCCKNTSDPEYDYYPPSKNIQNNIKQLNQHIIKQDITS